MKNFLKKMLIAGAVLAATIAIGMNRQQTVSAAQANNGVSDNGWLHVEGTQLTNEYGAPVTLHGMSTHGIMWFPQFSGQTAADAVAEAGGNLFRVAMYTDEYAGYVSNPQAAKDQMYESVDAAIADDMYVIIDWHVLNQLNGDFHNDAAVDFFNEVSAHYANTPNVLYEICNEPNDGSGNNSWSGTIKPYAEQVIPVIRANSPNSIAIVGTPTWSQEVDTATADPLDYSNVMYTLHFYAGTHFQWLRDKAQTALDRGYAIFVTEWGTCDASGNGGMNLTEAQNWIDFMNEKNISWANWSFCNKGESASALQTWVTEDDIRDGVQDYELTESGAFVFANLRTETKVSYDYSLVYDNAYYAAHNPDVAKAYNNDSAKMFQHFVKYGIKEGRKANLTFDVKYYQANNTDLKNAYGDNWEAYFKHFMKYGVTEGRKSSVIYNGRYYVQKNNDLKSAFGTDYLRLYKHFMNYGMKEGRVASADFNIVIYLNNYPDLYKAYGNNKAAYYRHFVNYGIKEGRTATVRKSNYWYGTDYSAVYSYEFYIVKRPDVAKAFNYNRELIFEHFVKYGMDEGSQASASFNPAVYKSKYTDLRNAFGNSSRRYYMHYLNYGIKEGRSAV